MSDHHTYGVIRPAGTSMAAVLSFVGFAVHSCGFFVVDWAFANLLDGLGGLAILMMLGPFGIGLAVLGLLEATAAVGLASGGVLLLCRRRAGVWVTTAACAVGCLAALVLAARIVPAPVVFGKTAGGIPSYGLALAICVCVVALAAVTMALALRALASRTGYGSSSKPCSMA